MRQQGDFILFENAFEFDEWLTTIEVSRTIEKIQNHHTYRPQYKDFNGSNHFTLVQNMKNYHVSTNKWSDIAQNFTSFPDGTIVTGRDISIMPAGIKGANAAAICIEHLGYFDTGYDVMTKAHKNIIVEMNAALCKRFDLAVNENTVIYHHWWDRVTGKRTNGSGKTKSCPGTNFFGGNKVYHAQANFYPLIRNSRIINPTTQSNFEVEQSNDKPIQDVVIETVNDVKDEAFENFDILVSNVAVWEDSMEDERKHLPTILDKAIVVIFLSVGFFGVIFLIALFLKKMKV